ncbi:allantoinase AllB [Nakamurella leprariae]|uniref:allantoinase n=1 Tax=Nakamurella leprariae TaxID=2803911 RepID=A0A939C288_9ACTN|nr:allantoinase AllB [Nakamurella leprariae]MBM9467877.1 allantoinase AllB [Nakamurella leprariae]
MRADRHPVDLVIHASRALIDGAEQAASVSVRLGRIVAIDEFGAAGPGGQQVTLDEDAVLVPGIVDTHVHVNEPGRTEWEGFDTATRAAAVAGVTTIVDMPLNSLPPTLSASALAAKQVAARGRVRVDTGFWGGLVPDNLDELPGLFAAGVLGVKCFLQDSGVPEFPPVSAEVLRAGMEIIAGLGGLLLVHAEDPAVLHGAPAPQGPDYRAFVASRPVSAETTAIGTAIAAAAATGCRTHIVHLSSGAGAELIRRAKADGVPITAETCPHYLTLDAGTIPDGSPQFKCCPPIRGTADRDALWEALSDGTIDIVVTDHSPSTPEMKQLAVGDLGLAWGGIASLQFGFAAVLAEALDRGSALADVLRWMSTGPSDLAGLHHKGRLEVGADADLIALAVDETFIVTADLIRHRHPVTPYLGRTLRGVVRHRWLGGAELRPDDPAPAGRLLSAGSA